VHQDFDALRPAHDTHCHGMPLYPREVAQYAEEKKRTGEVHNWFGLGEQLALEDTP